MKSSKTFSVLTVSKRPPNGWAKIAERSIRRQTVKPSSWVVIQEGVNSPPKTRVSNLNASLNAGLRYIDYIDTDYVIFYQDFIELQPDCFEKLLDLATPDTFVTTCTPNYDSSNDSRYTGCNCVRECPPRNWEANVAIAPMGIIRQLGGFDEEYDNGWAWDNVNLAQRAFLLGCKFLIDETNRPKLYPHDQIDHTTLTSNADRHTQTMQDIMDGKKPLKLNYLDAEHGASTV